MQILIFILFYFIVYLKLASIVNYQTYNEYRFGKPQLLCSRSLSVIWIIGTRLIGILLTQSSLVKTTRKPVFTLSKVRLPSLLDLVLRVSKLDLRDLGSSVCCSKTVINMIKWVKIPTWYR